MRRMCCQRLLSKNQCLPCGLAIVRWETSPTIINSGTAVLIVFAGCLCRCACIGRLSYIISTNQRCQHIRNRHQLLSRTLFCEHTRVFSTHVNAHYSLTTIDCIAWSLFWRHTRICAWRQARKKEDDHFRTRTQFHGRNATMPGLVIASDDRGAARQRLRHGHDQHHVACIPC